MAEVAGALAKKIQSAFTYKVYFLRMRKDKPPRPVAISSGKRQRTRMGLLRAAGDLVLEVGYENVTMDAVAARAGMSRGAIYGNFADRGELLAALALEGWKPVRPAQVPGATVRESLRRLGSAYWSAARDRASASVFAAAFQMQVRQNEALRARLSMEYRRLAAASAEELEGLYPRDQLPMEPLTFIKVLTSLGEGLMSAYFADPDEFPEDVFVTAFEALARET